MNNDAKYLTKMELAGIHMTSSFLQITISLPFSHPIDTIKSRMQTLVYKGNWYDIISQIKNSGFKSMYKGYIAMYFNLIMKQPAKLAVYEHISNPLYAGLATGFTGLCVGIPMSYIKTNYQVNPEFKLANLMKSGLSGFAKSFVAWKYEAGKEVIGNTAFYGLYKILNTVREHDNHSYLHIFLLPVLNKITTNPKEQQKKIISLENGAIAGFLGTYASFPVDTLKSYKQTKLQNGTFKHVFNEIYYQTKILPEDLNVVKIKYCHLIPSYKNFWNGVSITAVKHGIIGGIGMLLYESIKPQVKQYVLDNK